MSKITAGQVAITLDGEPRHLTPTLNAATGISRQFGGLQAAQQRVLAQDLDAYVAIVRFGLGLRTDAEAKGLAEKVFAAGVRDMALPLVEFLIILANGGKPVEDKAEPEGDAGNGAG
jgi:hypothetical protein